MNRRPGDLRSLAESAWRVGVAAVDPRSCVARHLALRPDLSTNSSSSLVVAVGKAGAAMMRGALPVARGLVLCPRGGAPEEFPGQIEVLWGGHPEPTLEGIDSSRRVIRAVRALGEGERLLLLLSGGASSLLEVPAGDLTATDVISAYRVLVGSGAAIDEINRVRCCLSAVKGGALLATAAPARVSTLAISDVVGDDPATIGSGPTFPCRPDAREALQIIERHGMQMPAAVLAYLQATGSRRLEGHRHPAQGADAEVDYTIVARVGDAIGAAAGFLASRGCEVFLGSGPLQGETGSAADKVASTIEALRDDQTGSRLRAWISGGETTVRLPPGCSGRGGRNLDLAARLALALAGREGFACAIGGTDGRDGSSRAAGAVIDADSAERAASTGFPLKNALAAFDTEPALEASGDLLVTGPTGTNVGDLFVAAFEG